MPIAATDTWMRRQHTLAEFATLALAASDFADVLEHACRLAARGLDCPVAKVLKWRPEDGDLLLCASVGIPRDVATPGETRIPGGRQSAAGYCLERRVPVIADLARETRFEPSEMVRRTGIRHSLNVVIACGGDMYGVMEADRVEDRPFGEDDIDFLQAFGSLIGAAVLRLRDAERIRHLLHEKELLLRELQHRVKNDLQVIIGIIGLQMRRAKSVEAQEQLEAVSGRIDSLRLVHDHLYKAQGLEQLDLGDYLRTLASDRFRMHGHDPDGPIRLELQVEPLSADRDLAMPLGLIANEFITNSFKHAFPRGAGTIRLTVARLGERQARLTLEDDGAARGAPPETGTGLKLVELLARQIRAQARWSRAAGTRLELVFNVGPAAAGNATE